MKKIVLMALGGMLCLSSMAKEKVTITVKNGLDRSRTNEMIETDVNMLREKLGSNYVKITDAAGTEIPCQTTYDGKLIFQANVEPKVKSIYYAVAGKPQEAKQKAKGRLFYERGTEFGWENDRVAFRIYGGGAAVGYDLFNKATDEMMLDYWYASEQNQEMRSVSRQLKERGYEDLADQVYNAYCYHINHGKGMDCYTVGPTLGCGGDALVNEDGGLCLPQCYEKYEILDNGPLRFTVRLTYPAVTYKGQTVHETRILSLDAGSQLNRAEVTFEGLPENAMITTGVVIHQQNPQAYSIQQTEGYIGYDDPGDPSPYNPKYRDELAKQMGHIFVGTVYPTALSDAKFQERPVGIATGHALGFAPIKAGETYVYYFGTGWSGNPLTSFHSLDDWCQYLSARSSALRNPLQIKIK